MGVRRFRIVLKRRADAGVLCTKRMPVGGERGSCCVVEEIQFCWRVYDWEGSIGVGVVLGKMYAVR
jgi:hypothetical protein